MDVKSVPVQTADRRKLPLGFFSGIKPAQGGKVRLLRSVAKLLTSGGVSLFRYLVKTGLFRDPGVVILSPAEHANFGSDDIGRITTLVTLRRLNLVKHLEMFLNCLARILPADANFVGCFSQPDPGDTADGDVGQVQHKSTLSFFVHHDHYESHFLNRGKVSELLERNGLRLVSMAEINGITWFHSRKVSGHSFMTA